MTDTADHADYVLPATTQLEHWDVHTSYGHTDVLLNQPAIAPLGEARPNTQIFRELARAHGLRRAVLRATTTRRCAAAPSRERGRLRRSCCAQGLAKLPIADAPFADGGFPTPSGRCEFFSERLARQGQDGLPDHVPNYEPRRQLGARYPLAMISPPARNFLNSTFVNVKQPARHRGRAAARDPRRTTPPRAASPTAQHGARLQRPRRATAARPRSAPRARPGVVNGLGIWWRKLGVDGTNVNELTSQRLTDIGRAPTFYDCLVEVRAG